MVQPLHPRGVGATGLPTGRYVLGVVDGKITGLAAESGGGGGADLPAGGDAGEVLTKQSATDGDADWTPPTRWEVAVTGSPPTEVTNADDTDWLYVEVTS